MATEIKYPESLQALLTTILGSKNVYFQPPDSSKMKYPCIVYHLDSINTQYADNADYFKYKGYRLTYIDGTPDMTVPDKLDALPLCAFVRVFTAENRNHYVYKLYHKEVYNHENPVG